MKETYTISKYVSIWRLDGDGAKGDLFMGFRESFGL